MNEKFGELFQKSITIINNFTNEISYLSLDSLKNLDPSIDKMAQTIKLVANFLKTIASEPFYDENKAINIFQCSLIMERMAASVKDNNLKEFRSLLKELEKHAQY